MKNYFVINSLTKSDATLIFSNEVLKLTKAKTCYAEIARSYILKILLNSQNNDKKNDLNIKEIDLEIVYKIILEYAQKEESFPYVFLPNYLGILKPILKQDKLDYLCDNNLHRDPLPIVASRFNAPKLMNALLSLNVDLNILDKHNNTAFHYSCQNNFPKIANLLIDYYLKTDQEWGIIELNSQGKTPVYLAEKSNMDTCFINRLKKISLDIELNYMMNE